MTMKPSKKIKARKFPECLVVREIAGEKTKKTANSKGN